MTSTNPKLKHLSDLRPRITVIGVGGAGCNAVNNMISAGLTGVDFVVANTDAQALAVSSAEHRLQLGERLTEGLGAGSRPEIGEAAAQEAIEAIREQIAGSHMVFVAAGMGGGTGTGAASVIARVAKDLGILTVGVVTKPFQFEGVRRMRIAEAGIEELKQYVDTLIVIPNQNLFRVANEKTTFEEAFVLADQVLYSGVACIVDLIVKEGLINLDFADVRTVMSGMGTAMMGTGEASGQGRAIVAAEEAISNPLLDDVTLRGAKGLLLSITGSHNLTLYEVHEAANRVRDEVDPDANIIVGATFDETLDDRVRVSIVASGMAPVADRGTAQAQAAGMAGLQSSRGPAPGAPFEVRKASAMMPPPLPQMAPAPAEPAHEDVQRRLSEALQHATEGDGDEDGFEDHEMIEQWQAPGNVVIEAGLPDMEPVVRSVPPRMTDSVPPAFGDSAFTPRAPVELPHRRMPAIEDFPPVGQRDYYAKKPSGGAGPHPAGVPPQAGARQGAQRRPGLFERLTGRRRQAAEASVADSHAGNANHFRSGTDHSTANAPAQWSQDQQRGAVPPSTEQPELPVFFNNKRR